MRKRVGIAAGHRGLVGILGGSFDPPHGGHLYIATRAKKVLNLREIWWLVAWGHTQKRRINGSNFCTRLQQTSTFLGNRSGHRVCDLEKRRFVSRSLDSVRLLKQSNQGANFVWIMGSDSFINLHKWSNWRLFVKEVSILVVSRDRLLDRRLRSSKVGNYLKGRYRRMSGFSKGCWTLLPTRLLPLSSSIIREKKEC